MACATPATAEAWTTDERAALTRAILVNPADDLPRLVFADWLDEHGEHERAEYIRKQIRLTRLPGAWEFDTERDSLTQRIDQITDNGSPALWLALDLDLEPFDWHWSGDSINPRIHTAERIYGLDRGFVSHIELPAASFMEHAGVIFRAQPVTSVRLADVRPETGAFHRHEEPTWSLQDKRFWLWDLKREGWVSSCRLPWDIYRRVPNDVGAVGIKQYLSEDRAFRALSIACVDYGRNLAGLDPLPEPEQV